jgi:lipoprotein LprG
MRRYPTATRLTAAAFTGLLALAGCSRGGGDGDLPDGGELLQAAAGEMAQVETVAIRLTADAELANLPVREVAGVITRAGAAQGTAQVEQLGQRLEVQFVVLDDTFYYQLLGGWQELPLSEATDFYDPSTVLDPDRGVANLLRTATDPSVERDGDTYRVTASFSAEALSGLVPGAADGTRGTVWIGVERPLLHRAQFPLPAGAGEPGTLSVELSDFDQPVDIRAP